MYNLLKRLTMLGLILGLVLAFPTPLLAQGMMDGANLAGQSGGEHTVLEEAEGQKIWDELQKNKLRCQDLSDGNFGALGEYFMGQMMGRQHEAMNKMMIQMMGEEGEEQMHIAMGKRLSGCQPNAAISKTMMTSNMMPMMMNWGGGFGAGWAWLGWILMVLFWIFIVVGTIAFIKWTIDQVTGRSKRDSALEILKERYAKGEIDKKEFEEKRRDLV